MPTGASRSVQVLLLALLFTASAALLIPHKAHASDLGLVGYWSFDEGTGTQATDFSGNVNTGTTTGTTWVSGKHGKALNFDGITNYVDVGNSNGATMVD